VSRLEFGRDRIPNAWGGPEWALECKPGRHLVDSSIDRCTVCGWLDPETDRCETVGCIRPADYEVEVGPKDEGPAFTTVIRSAKFCSSHAFTGGIAIVPPDGPVS
jgi:hypothetical protein